MSETNRLYLAIDMGGTFLKSAVMDVHGNVREESELSVPSRSDGSKEEIMDSLEKCIATGMSFIRKSGSRVEGIGIAIPGPFDYQNGISWMQHKFQSLYQVNLKEQIQNMPDMEADIPVCFIHDANAVLMGEQWLGYARHYSNTAVITLGTGIGFSHSQNKIIQCNPMGSPAVSIYSTPCKDGILEDYVSQRGILNMYKKLNVNNTGEQISVYDIARQAGHGDPSGLEAFRMTGYILSGSIAAILQEKQIECLLFGGQISRSYEYFEASCREGLREVRSLKKISPVKSIDNAAFYGILADILSYKEKLCLHEK